MEGRGARPDGGVRGGRLRGVSGVGPGVRGGRLGGEGVGPGMRGLSVRSVIVGQLELGG